MSMTYAFYLIMDDTLCLPDRMPAILNTILDCGITCVQLRMKKSSSQTIMDTTIKLKTLLSKKNLPLIINDHVNVVKEADVDGVHLGQSDMSVQEARNQLGDNKIIGLSIENVNQAIRCKDEPVNYFGVGPVFPTATKEDTDKPIGVDELKKIMIFLKKPIVAIGGINLENANLILSTGAGVAVASYLLSSSNIPLAGKKLASLIFKKMPS